MASNFEVIYPKSDKITFDGGMNNKFSKQLININESPSCQNVVFGNRSVQTRGGTTQLNTTSVGTFACDGIYTRHDNGGTETMCAWYNGALYTLGGTTFVAVASAVSVFTAGQRVCAAEYENYIFFGNGGSNPYKYNGTTFTRHGIPAPTTAPVAATAATGTALSGVYSYKVTYVNSAAVEGDVSPAVTVSATAENIALTSIPVAPISFGVNSRYIYRTETSGVVYYFLDEISDNTTTTYEDGTPDDELSALTAPTDNGVPPNYCAIVFHQARLFAIDSGNNWVVYSELGNPYVFKSTNFRRVGDNTFDIPKALAVWDNSVYVFCKNSIWLIYMESVDDSSWVNVRISSSYGSNSPFGCFLFNNRVMFAATEAADFIGFGALSGGSVDPSATLLTNSAVKSDLQSSMIEPDMENVVNAYIDRISSIVFKNKAYVTMTYGSGSTTNNRIYHFDFSMENLRKDQKFMWSPWTGLEAAQFTIYGNKIYYGSSSTDGFVYEMLTSTYNDNGSAIDSFYWTKEFDCNQPQWQKDFRWLNILYGLFGDYFMNITTKVDSDSGSGSTDQISVNPGGTLWGQFTWGNANWDAGRDDKEIKKSLGKFKGKRIQFKFDNQNTIDQAFKLVEMTITFNLRGKR